MDNTLRRAKIKLKLLEVEGVDWLLGDAYDFLNIGEYTVETPEYIEEKIKFIEKFKEFYQVQIEFFSTPDNKQGKLEL